MLKEVEKQPEEGQFVVVWEFGGRVWSGVFRIETHGDRQALSSFEDDRWEFEAGWDVGHSPSIAAEHGENRRIFVVEN